MTRILRLILALVACLGAGAGASHAGNLEVYESSVGIGQVRALPGPVTNALINIYYAPSTAEGGKLFGMSELDIETTGNLVLTPVGFACPATSCLYSPQPLVTGNGIQLTAGNDLAGETATAASLVRFGLTGSSGHVVLVGGEYLDGTGSGGTVGSVQTIDITILATVPEPGLASGLAVACALLVVAARTHSRCPPSRTISR